MSLSRLQLWEAGEEHGEEDKLNVVYAFVTSSLNITNETKKWQKDTKATISNVLYKCNEKLQKAGRHKGRFKTKFQEWLCETVDFDVPPMKLVRTQVPFDNLSLPRKRIRTQELRASTSSGELSFATQMKLRECGQHKAASVVQKAVEASPRTLQVIYAFVKERQNGSVREGPLPYSVEEALAHQYQCRLTKDQYIFNAKSLVAHNAKLFPPYAKLTEYRKNHCYPVGITVSETKASVPLQAMVDHTAKRLLLAVADVLKAVPPESLLNLELISKIGFDGSSNHSQYNQKWQTEGCDDNSIVMTSIVPLLIHFKDNPTGKVTIIWLNQRPSSTVHCRPLELEFTKETTQMIVSHSRFLEESIKNLTPTEIREEFRIKCSHTVLSTMVDGKIANAATSTSNQSCNVCKATPKLMNNIQELLQRTCDASAFKYGISVLHANIRFLEYMLNLTYRLEIKKGYTVYTTEEKESMKTRKSLIIKRFKDYMGLNIDRPGGSGGNTNTGNNARRFFDNPVKVSEITGLDLDVLKRCRTVLRTISSGYGIDTQKFHVFAVETAEMIVQRYPWYYMPSSVHKILLHGAAFMDYFPVPIGFLSEEASECRNKDLRYIRLHHSRKMSRDLNMRDMFEGLLARSDPVIASLRQPPKPKGEIDHQVMELLISTNEHGGFESGVTLSSILNESDESDVDDSDLN